MPKALSVYRSDAIPASSTTPPGSNNPQLSDFLIYTTFSSGHSQIDSVVKYILNQKEHHKKQTFREEHIDFLKKFEIEFIKDYLFKWIE